jgi:hypothetical protein
VQAHNEPIDCKDRVASKRTLAGAVAREIDRIAQSGEHFGEGAAYKAFHDSQGSDAAKHSRAFVKDAALMAIDTDLSGQGVSAAFRARVAA